MTDGGEERTKRLESRRMALARLALAATAAYSAPTILHLDRNAHATASSKGCTKGSPDCP